MRLLRLHDHAPGGADIELHPRLSVVSGLAPEARERLVAALAALPGGRAEGAADGVTGTLEVNGIVLDLEPEALALLDLDPRLETVVTAGDLRAPGPTTGDGEGGTTPDGSAPDPAAVEQARRSARDAAATHDLLRRSVEELEESHRRVQARRAALALALADADLGAPAPTEPSTGDAVEVAHTVVRSATVVLDSPGPTAEAVAAIASAAARVDRLRTRRDETLAELEPLVDLEVGPVTAALAAVPRGDAAAEVPDPAAQAAADELEAAVAALEAYDERLESTGQGPLGAYRRLDESQRRFLAAEAAVRPPVVDPAEAQALEAAHDQVLEAELRLTAARIPGKKLKERLDEAAAAEQAVLARMGFATYTAFVMSTTVPVVSPELRAAHEQAQRDYEQADAAFARAVAAVEQDPQRATLAVAVESAQAAARRLVDVTDERDLVAALRARTVADPEQAGAAARSVAGLRAALEDAGVDFGDLELSDGDVIDVASAWLADMADAIERREALEATLRAVEAEVAEAEAGLARLETSAPSAAGLADPEAGAGTPPSADAASEATTDPVDAAGDAPLDPDGDAGDDGADDLQASLAGLDAELQALAEQVDAQHALLAAAAAAHEGATAHLVALEGGLPDPLDVDGPSFGVATTIAPVGGQGGPVSDVGQVEWYLLARLASLRSVSYAGSLPLVLDDPFAHVADDDVDYLLERLVRTSDAVQVIYVGDDPRVLRWGRDADAGVCSLTAG
ncbi:MAG: hypothetical protein KDB35_16820 [Acidimicrobiales bacterium]|nr:hypothetical protein [Acidimicrobiales bacterium]MCB1015470.1 hypothetical protein [Acidimicrobiales bacterium]